MRHVLLMMLVDPAIQLALKLWLLVVLQEDMLIGKLCKLLGSNYISAFLFSL